MMVMCFQLSTVSAKAESFFSRLCRLLLGAERWTLGVECWLLDVQIYTYDLLGQPLLTCQDLDLDGQITLSGPDRVSGSAAYYHQIGANWWHETVSWIYPENGSDIVLTNSLTRRRLTGLGSTYNADGADGVLSAESISIDIRCNETIIRSVVNRDVKSVYQLVYAPNSTVAALATTVNGFLVASRSSSGNTTTFSYDALGRQGQPLRMDFTRGGFAVPYCGHGNASTSRVSWCDLSCDLPDGWELAHG